MSPLNHNLQKLFDIAQKEEKLGIGLMSGTSLDGLDIALCGFSGNGLQTKIKLIQFITVPYSDEFKQQLKLIFAQKTADIGLLCVLNAYIGDFYAELVLQALSDWHIDPKTVDFIASHGQTVFHAPKRLHQDSGYPNATLQIGDGDHIAVKTGLLTVSDFRQKHVAAGGEGAPLALFGDVILGSKTGENRVLLNIGGVANLTFLPADSNTNEIICSDIGPGNTLIDAACREYFNLPYDENAKFANAGRINDDLLTALLDHTFFTEYLPKTTGPELFNLDYIRLAQIKSSTENIGKNDLIATMSAFTTTAIADFIKTHIKATGLKIFISGGGARNPFIIKNLKTMLPGTSLDTTSALGIDPDAKEAILFALLGNEALSGEPISIGHNPAVLMGKFSFPL